MPKTLYLPVGVPGCGKSTYAGEISYYETPRHEMEIIPMSAIVSPDQIRYALTDDVSNQDCNGVVFGIVDTIIAERMRRGLDIYLDATNLYQRGRTALLKQATEVHGYEVVILRFTAGESEVRARNAERERVVPEHVMDRMFELLSAVDWPAFCEIPQVTIKEIG